MTIRQALNKGMIILKSNNVDSPKLKARLLLQYILNQPRQYLIVYDDKEISKKEQWEYFVDIEKLTNGIPLQHITHRQEFMKMDFYVDKNVLIPRPDTEILVEETIRIASKIKNPVILDLCTGSGAIGISIAKNIPDAKIYAIDISTKALEIAEKNAKKLGTIKQMNFIESNLFEKIKNKKFDIIVSNPPYIRKNDINYLSKEVQEEPEIALDGGNDGLEFYRKIIKEAPNYLKLGSYLCLEIGYDQKQEVFDIFKNYKTYSDIYSKKDLYGNDRIIIARLDI